MTEQNLYELTGNILHINILLVHRADLNKLVTEIDELRAENTRIDADRRDMFIELESLKLKLAEQRMILFDHEMADYKGEAEMLRAQILEQRRVIESMQPRTIGDIGTSCGEYVECTGRPDAPHGVDLEASFRTGRTVCVCKSWAPGEAS